MKNKFSFLSILLSLFVTTVAQASPFSNPFSSPRPQFVVIDGTCSAGFCTNDPTITCTYDEDCKASFSDTNNIVNLDKDAANSNLCRDLGRNIGVASGHLFQDNNCNGSKDTGENYLDIESFSSPAGIFYGEVGGNDAGNDTCGVSNPCKYLDHIYKVAQDWYIANCNFRTSTAYNCTRPVIKLGIGTFPLSEKKGVTTIKPAYLSSTIGMGSLTKIEVNPQKNECGVDLTGTAAALISLQILNLSLNPDQWGTACTKGGSLGGGLSNVYLNTAWARSKNKALHFGFYGLGNATSGIHNDTETFDASALEGGVQIFHETSKQAVQTNEKRGRCTSGHPYVNGGCNDDADCQGRCIKSDTAGEINTSCTQNTDCGTNGECLEAGLANSSQASCLLESGSDMGEQNSWFQASGVVYKETNAQFCDHATETKPYVGLACANNSDCNKGSCINSACYGGIMDGAGPCSVNADCNTGYTCKYAIASDNKIVFNNNLLFTNSNEGGVCYDATNHSDDGKNCWAKCTGTNGTNNGVRCDAKDSTGANYCDIGSCETGRCEGGWNNNYPCDNNTDCDSALCLPRECNDNNPGIFGAGCDWYNNPKLFWCQGGANINQACDEDSDCPSSTCGQYIYGYSLSKDFLSTCAGGVNSGKACIHNLDCPASNCASSGISDPGWTNNCADLSENGSFVGGDCSPNADCAEQCLAGGVVLDQKINGTTDDRLNALTIDLINNRSTDFGTGTRDFDVLFLGGGGNYGQPNGVCDFDDSGVNVNYSISCINARNYGSFFDNTKILNTNVSNSGTLYTAPRILTQKAGLGIKTLVFENTAAAPSTPVPAEMWFDSTQGSYGRVCYKGKNNASPTICIIDDQSPIGTNAGGSGLTSVADNGFLYCDSTDASCNTENLSVLVPGSQSVLGRQAGAPVAISFGDGQVLGKLSGQNVVSQTITESFVASNDKTGSGRFVLQNAPTLGGGAGSKPIICADCTPDSDMGVTNKKYVDDRDVDTKCVNFANATGIPNDSSPVAVWTNNTGRSILVTDINCFTDTGTAGLDYDECTTDPDCKDGATHTNTDAGTSCDTDGFFKDISDMTIEDNNSVSINVTATASTPKLLGACFTIK